MLAAALACGAACRPATVVAIRAIDGFPVLDATIDGVAVSFVLDTGAQAHLILPAAQAVLRLPLLPGTVPLIGTGGARDAAIVRLDGVRLGDAVLDATAAPVSGLPALPLVAPMLAGLLGAPLLYQFDLELDIVAGRVTLFEAGGCTPEFRAQTTVVALGITRDHRAVLPVQVNGQTVLALLDTGSRATLLTAAAAARLGLRAQLSANTAQGVDEERLPVAHVLVDTLAVGDDVRRGAPVSIAPLQLEDAEMLLGFDYLRQRRVWISYVSGRLLIALPDPAASGSRSPARPPPGRLQR